MNEFANLELQNSLKILDPEQNLKREESTFLEKLSHRLACLPPVDLETMLINSDVLSQHYHIDYDTFVDLVTNARKSRRDSLKQNRTWSSFPHATKIGSGTSNRQGMESMTSGRKTSRSPSPDTYGLSPQEN